MAKLTNAALVIFCMSAAWWQMCNEFVGCRANLHCTELMIIELLEISSSIQP